MFQATVARGMVAGAVAAALLDCHREPPGAAMPPRALPDAAAPVAAAAASTSFDAGAPAGPPAEPASTPLRCDGHPLEVGREWTEVVETSVKPQGPNGGCYLFGTAEASKRTTRIKKKILAMDAGRVARLRLTYVSYPGTSESSLEGSSFVVDLTRDPPEVDTTKHAEIIRSDARESFIAWPKTNDAKASSKALLGWRFPDANPESFKGTAKVKPAKASSSFPAASTFSVVSDSSEWSGGMCHSGSSEKHDSGTIAVVDGAVVVEAKLTTVVKAFEGTCQGCGPKGDQRCPEVRCMGALEIYVLRVLCEP